MRLKTMASVWPTCPSPRVLLLLLLLSTSLPSIHGQTSTAIPSLTADAADSTSAPLSPPAASATLTPPLNPTTTGSAETSATTSTSTRPVTLTAPPPVRNSSLGPGDPTDGVSVAIVTAPAPGCGPGLDPVYSNLCDKQAAWGIVVESLAALGVVLGLSLLLGLVLWGLWRCCFCSCRLRSSHCGRGSGGSVASLGLFLLGAAGLLALTFAFVVRLTPRTCPTRLFLFGVLSAVCFSALLARCLALLGFAVARGWAEPGTVLVLSLVQVIIAVEWLLVVLVRDRLPCSYSQPEFAMLLIYVLCLLAATLVLAVRLVWRTRRTYGYSYRHTASWSREGHTQAALLLGTALLVAALWVVWIALLTRGNREMGRQPGWDDPVLAVALVSSGWVLLLGHGVSQLVFLCRGERRAKGSPLDFTSWTSPSPGMGSLPSPTSPDPKGGRDNGSFENDTADNRKGGKRSEPVLRSPYESGFSMTEIDPDKDYSIPRPQTTNINEPYDDYYGPSVGN
ncbi:retinoic acid-induced protein 3 [Engraulis encrasicolus]|uniref:retinoic acid-induced protein 3 n=1 Tax=Engraulis encrasicolus TaxID=184585 RepID=UPI002FD331F0